MISSNMLGNAIGSITKLSGKPLNPINIIVVASSSEIPASRCNFFTAAAININISFFLILKDKHFYVHVLAFLKLCLIYFTVKKALPKQCLTPPG